MQLHGLARKSQEDRPDGWNQPVEQAVGQELVVEEQRQPHKKIICHYGGCLMGVDS